MFVGVCQAVRGVGSGYSVGFWREGLAVGEGGEGPWSLLPGAPKVSRNASEGRRNSETKLAGVSVCAAACDGVDIKTETKPDVV